MFLACSNCHEIMLKSMDDVAKLRSKVILLKNDNVYAICKGCDTEIQVPLKVDIDLAKSIASKPDSLLYLKVQK